MTLSLGFSPCPNDCFMFDAIVNHRIDLEGLEFAVRMADVEALNKSAFAGEAAVTKLSYHAYAHCTHNYVLLDAGSAGEGTVGRCSFPAGRSRKRRSPLAGSGSSFRKIYDRQFPSRPAFPEARDKTELVFSAIKRRCSGDTTLG